MIWSEKKYGNIYIAEGNDMESNRNYQLYFMKSTQTGDMKED